MVAVNTVTTVQIVKLRCRKKRVSARVRCVGGCKVCIDCCEGNPEALSFAVEPFSSLYKPERVQ